jgi:hypothetical protein
MEGRPSVSKMAAAQRRMAEARRKRQEEKERQQSEEADQLPGAAFGYGQVMLRERQKAERREAREREEAEQRAKKLQQEQEEERQITAALDLEDQVEQMQLRIAPEVKKQVAKLFEGTGYSTLVAYPLLRAMTVHGQAWAKLTSPEVPPEDGVTVQLAVLKLPVEMPAQGLYRSFADHLAPTAVYKPGVVDMPRVRAKKDGSEPTEGKWAAIAVEMTQSIRQFLVTGQGWELPVVEAGGVKVETQAVAHIRRHRSLWIKIQKGDAGLFFKVARLLKLSYRDTVWQACRCLTACYQAHGARVRFTTIEFGTTGRREKGRQGPAVDYHEDDVQIFAVVATEEERRTAEYTLVPKSLWFEQATMEALQSTAWVVPVHFEFTWSPLKRVDPEEQAVQDARDQLLRMVPHACRTPGREDYVVQITVKMTQQEQREYLQDHHAGARLGMLIAAGLQEHLCSASGHPVGIGVVVRGDQTRLDQGIMVAVCGKEEGQEMMRAHQGGKLQLIKGVAANKLQFKVCSIKKEQKEQNEATEWTVVRRSLKVSGERISRLVQATGCSISELKRFAAVVVEELEAGPMTLPARTVEGYSIPPGEQTPGIERWAPLRREDLDDVRRRMPGAPEGRVLPLLLEIMVQAGEIVITPQPDLLSFRISIPVAGEEEGSEQEEEDEEGKGRERRRRVRMETETGRDREMQQGSAPSPSLESYTDSEREEEEMETEGNSGSNAAADARARHPPEAGARGP